MRSDRFPRTAVRLQPRGVVARFAGFAFAAACLPTVGGCGPGRLIEPRDLSELQRTLADSKEPVLVDYYKAACEHCSAFEVTLGALAKDYKGRLAVRKFLLKRADGEFTAPDFAAEHEILSYPTAILYVNGRERKRLVQQYHYDDYVAAIEECLAAPTTQPAATKPAATQAGPASRGANEMEKSQ